MIKKIVFCILSGFSLTILLGLLLLRHIGGEKIADENKTVFIKKSDKGFQLIRNDKPFYINGASGNSHFEELSRAGGNTIRVYDTINLLSVLDEAQRNNLAVIVDIPLPAYYSKYNFYSGEANRKALLSKVTSLVNRYKHHPALLLWNLGNELFYPLVIRKNSFIGTFNELIDIIHREDPDHPVCTTISGVYRKEQISIYLHSPQLDLLAFNIFGDIRNLQTKLRYITFAFGAKPYYISEFGSDGWWESETTTWKAPKEHTNSKKAEQINERFSTIEGNNDGQCLGAMVFFWGYKHERTYTWFSLFKGNIKSEIVKVIESQWKKSGPSPEIIGIEGVIVKGIDITGELIFIPGEERNSEIRFTDPEQKYDSIKWEIYHEEWSRDTTNMKLNYPEPVDSFVKFDNNSATFVTPQDEGPYRLFAYIYDKGYFSSANTPFYVLRKK
jgi:hypothetical protein